MTTYTLGFTGAEIDSRLGSAGTALQPSSLSDLAQTWNDSGTTFTAIKMNVTDTASASDSLLMDLQVGGSSKFSVSKLGILNNISGVEFAFGNYSFNFSAANFVIQDYDGQDIIGFLRRSGGFKLANTFLGFGLNYYTADLRLYRDAANTLGQRNSTNPQTFNLYNTYTDGSNYERGFMKWNSNVLEIGTEALGTGTGRDVVLNGSNRVSKISDVSTGTDAAYETAINAIIDALEAHGLAATV